VSRYIAGSEHSDYMTFLQIRLKHRDTNAYLASSEGAKFGHPIGGQQEVCAVRNKDKNSQWQTAEGIFMPTIEGLDNLSNQDSQDEL